MLFSVLTRKGRVPRHSFHPPRSRSWLRGGRSQLAAPSGPGSHTLPSYHHWGSEVSKPTGPQAPRAAQGGGAGPTDCDPHKLLLILGHRDKDGGEGQHCFKAWAKASGWPWWGLLSPAWHSPQPVSLVPHHPLAQDQGAGWRAQGSRQASTSYFTLHLMATVLLTAGWIKSLMVSHWQLVACGKGPL